MASPPLVSLTVLQERLGRSLSVDEAREAEGLLRRASSLIRDEAGQTWLNTDGTLTAVPDSVEDIVVAVIRRRLDNPDGYSSETMGPFTYRRAAGADQADLFLTRTEERILRRFRGSRIGSIGLVTDTGGTASREVYFDSAGSPIEPWVYPAW